ncbi:MAG TPA: hypothetical protein VHH11_13910 [Gammaproteobacteria bacterium]|nr:hypothetical protein [Gammaproteobacteria bacterium]
MIATTLLVALLSQHLPGVTPRRLEERAEAIAVAGATTREELAVLVSIDLVETGLGRAGVPWGMCARLCRRACGQCRTEPLADTARAAVATWRRARLACGPSLVARHHWYRLGYCGADLEAKRRARSTLRWARRLRGAL